MMEIKEAIRMLETCNNTHTKNCDCRYCESHKVAVSLLSKIQDAEMPQRKIPELFFTPRGDGKLVSANHLANNSNLIEKQRLINNANFVEGYNQCHDDFLAYHLKKMEERVDVLKLKDIMNTKCQECKSVREGCQFTCSILPNALAKEIE